MTQTPTVQAAALVPNQEIDFRLEVLRPNGERHSPPRIFDSTTESRVGVVDGLTSVIAPGGACKSVSFSGRKDYVVCEGGEIIKFEVNDGYGWQPAGYGTITTGHAGASLETSGDLIRRYEARTEDLLRDSVVTGDEVYPPQDVAAIARQLTAKYRHPALKYDGALMPNVGVKLDAPSDFPGATLLQALEGLAKKVEEVNNFPITFGVQADGRVFFRYASDTWSLPFEPSTYTELPIDASELCTAVFWVVGNKPNIENYTGSYEPGTLTHLSIPDAPLHEQYRRVKALQPSGNPFAPRAAVNPTIVSNFNSPEAAINTNPDGTPVWGTVSALPQTANINGRYSIFGKIDPKSNLDLDTVGGLPIYGCRIRYRLDPDTSDSSLVVTFQLVFRARRVGDASGAETYFSIQIPLQITVPVPAYLTKDFIFPSASVFYYENLDAWFEPVGTIYAAEMLAFRLGGVGPVLGISDFRFLCLDTPSLEAAAAREAKSPAQNPASLESTYLRDGLPVGRFVPGQTAVIHHTGRPKRDGGTENAMLPVAEIRYSFNRENKFECVVDVGNPAREGEDATLERIASGIDRKVQQSELDRGGRLQ